ncbi:hypothetical protein TNCV_937771 [Trichonephila clavipes]|nr:hypothetical protein TNCV_937771 [Trichonephila clavipes]
MQSLLVQTDVAREESDEIVDNNHDRKMGHSRVGIDGNEKADFLARTAPEEESPTGSLAFSELSSLKKIELHRLGRIPPSHPWYFRN